MSYYDEKTTELELPPTTTPKPANIVRVDFAAVSDARKMSQTVAPASTTAWVNEFDLHSPWVLRLLAVVFVLILSMLIL